MNHVCRIAFLTFISASAPFLSVPAADWYSVASGNAETAAVWSLTPAGPGNTAAALGGFNNSVNLTVQTGNTIDLYTTGNININNLTVETGGLFYSTNATNRYINIYGNILCDGVIGGNGIYNSICFNIEGLNTVLSGSGSFEASRIRKNGVVNLVTNFTIAKDVTLRWNAGTGTQLYNNASNTVFNVTIVAGYTVNMINGNISIDGTAGNGFNEMSGTVSVNGTLNVFNVMYVQTNNAVPGNSSNYIIGPTGKIAAYAISAGASGLGGSLISIAPGGILELNGNPTFNAFSTLNNTFDFQSGSYVIYSAAGNQVIQSAPVYGNLIAAVSGTKTSNGNLTAVNNIDITNTAVLDIAGFNIELGGNWSNWNSTGFTETGSAVSFTSSILQTINCPGGEQFYNLNVFNNSATGLLLNDDIAVSNQMDLGADGRLTFGAANRIVNVTNNTFSSGIIGSGIAAIDMTGGVHNLNIFAWNCNYTGALYGGSGTVNFCGTNNGSGFNQLIITGPAIDYYNVLLSGSGNKALMSDLTVRGSLTADGITVALKPLVALRILQISGDINLVNNGSMDNNCYSLLDIITVGNGLQVFTGNNNSIKSRNLSSIKIGGGITLTGPANFTTLETGNDLFIDFSNAALLIDNGNIIQVGDDAALGNALATAANFSLTGTLRFTGLGGDGEIHLSDATGAAVTKAYLHHLEVNAGSASGANNRLEVYPTIGGKTLNVMGNVTIGNASYLDPNINTTAVGGNWTSWSANGFIDALATVIFNGNGIQSITCPGGEGFYAVEINKPSGTLNLNSLIDVVGSFNFINGIVNSSTINLPRFYSGTVVMNASNVSHVNGPVRRTGTTPFTFPVGKNGYYRPLSLSVFPGSSAFLVEYYYSDPQSLPLIVNAKDPTLDHISRCEYWYVQRITGSTAAVRLSWDTPVSCGVTSLADLRVARWDGVQWKDLGNGGTTGNTNSGTVLTTSITPDFGYFTLSSSDPFQNPLPVSWLSFNVSLLDKNAQLHWATASEWNSDYFVIERAKDNSSFESWGVIKAQGTATTVSDYYFVDQNLSPGNYYYRLKQVDFGGEFEYSVVKSVTIPRDNFKMQLFPNPVEDVLTVQISDAYLYNTQIQVSDVLGKIIPVRWIVKDEQTLTADFSEIKSGIYFISVPGQINPQSYKVIVR